jgi:hypothetical protein
MRRLWTLFLTCMLLAAAMGWGAARLAAAPRRAEEDGAPARAEAQPAAPEADGAHEPQPTEPQATEPSEEAHAPEDASGQADSAKAEKSLVEPSKADASDADGAKADETEANAETPDAPKDEPVDPEVQRLREQIDAHFERAEYLQARPLIFHLIRKRPEDPDAWYNLACV